MTPKAFFEFLLSFDTFDFFKYYHKKGAPQGFIPFAMMFLSHQKKPTIEDVEQCLEVYLALDEIRNATNPKLVKEHGDVDASEMAKEMWPLLEKCAMNPADFYIVKELLVLLPDSTQVQLLLKFFQVVHGNPPLEKDIPVQCLNLFSKEKLCLLLSSKACLSRCSLSLYRCLERPDIRSDTETTPTDKEATQTDKEATSSDKEGTLFPRRLLEKAVNTVSNGAGKAVKTVSNGAGKAVNTISNGAGKAVRSVTKLAGKLSGLRFTGKRR